jgi:hypothetical protein
LKIVNVSNDFFWNSIVEPIADRDYVVELIPAFNPTKSSWLIEVFENSKILLFRDLVNIVAIPIPSRFVRLPSAIVLATPFRKLLSAVDKPASTWITVLEGLSPIFSREESFALLTPTFHSHAGTFLQVPDMDRFLDRLTLRVDADERGDDHD